MINGLGIVGWGVGGIEAEAGMLGQPVYFLTPDVVGVHLTGALREGVTATDLVLTVTQMLRQAKVVGKFVEFFGPGAASLAVADRATIANMAPEYGATMGFFPIDDETVEYLAATGRTERRKSTPSPGVLQGAGPLRHAAGRARSTTRKVLELDLADRVAPIVAGPKRPQDRIERSPDLKATSSRDLFSTSRSPENGFEASPPTNARAKRVSSRRTAKRAWSSATATC